MAVSLVGESGRLSGLTDSELLQVAVAARRQTSLAQARELAAIAELARRRGEDDPPEGYRGLSAHEAVAEEVAAALTVTGNAAAILVHLAERLTGPLAETLAALEAGYIDLTRARAISDGTENLPDEVVGRVQAAALEKASEQTSGQLRRRIKRLTERLAPQCVEERRREAIRQRRLELWESPAGTADLGLCDLPPEDAHAIYNKISAAARGIRADGDTRPLQCIRADLATQLLNGHPLPDAVQALISQAPPSVGPVSEPAEEVDGDVDAVIGELAGMADRQLGQVCDRAPAHARSMAVAHAVARLERRLGARRDTFCRSGDDTHGHPGYRAPAALRREIQARHSTCVFPTCNQPSHRCDLDHTTPWRPGITCRCNLAPLCRRHHRLKQTRGWKLHQLWPGLLIWVTPAGAWYIVRPDRR
ncbi:HNH endonuclease signature motif containing protein [Actinomadura chibensis]|uniref:HNH endonuclease signature motif containing protein n=1 Tax=Actinomadura chibensis TaxID=392828 RepID=UPI000B098975